MALTKQKSTGVDYSTFTPTKYADFEMIGKIAQSVIRNVSATNPLAMFEKRPVANGDTIEQVVIKLAEEKAYDKEGKDALNRLEGTGLAVRYFKDWTRTKFDQTIDISETRKVITESGSYDSITERLVSSLVEGDEHAKYESLKELLSWGTTNNAFVELSSVASGDYKGVLKTIKNTIKGFKFVGSSFNKAGIKTRTTTDSIYVLAPYKLITEIDVEELAGVFNLDKAEVRDRIIELDTEDDTVYVVDANAILFYTRLYEMADQKNADGLFWNYFLHVERLYAISPLFNAVFFKVNSTKNA